MMTPAPAVIPVWPAIIKHEGEDELTYISSHADWQADPILSAHPYQNTDILIDSDGQVFELFYDNALKRVHLNYAKMAISLSRFSELVQMHLAQLEQCCVSKITFRDYKQGFEMVASTSED